MTAVDLTSDGLSKLEDIKKFGLKRPLARAPPDTLFDSHNHFYSCLDIIADCQAPWELTRVVSRTNSSRTPLKYWKRDSLVVLQEILENPRIKEKCVWAPTKEYNADGERIYTDMHTTEWWWNVQVRCDHAKN